MSVKIMTRVWEQSKQKGTGLIALLAIADHADDYGVCWPGLDLIAKKARIKKRQVINVVEKLEGSGEVIVIHNRGRHVSNRYFITIGLSEDEIRETLETHPELQPVNEKGAKDCTISIRKKVQENAPYNNEEKVQFSAEKVQYLNGKGAIAITPEPSIEPSMNHHEEPGGPPVLQSKRNGWNKPADHEGRNGEVALSDYTNPEELAEAICILCKIHPSPELATPMQVQAVKGAVARLLPQKATLSELNEFESYWYTFDWRGKKYQPPTPMQICELWPRFKGAKLNGSPISKLNKDQLAAYQAMEATAGG